mmetsp:Transcript_29541/g.77748  ORF Transcript_29541/g.77748 Transcript_29541/m.77748 type:complete len:222 (+) Transcript_29541:8105-8770(+)
MLIIAGGTGIGSDGNFANYNDVWISPNGTYWVQALAAAPWAARQGLSMVVLSFPVRKLIILGGFACAAGCVAYQPTTVAGCAILAEATSTTCCLTSSTCATVEASQEVWQSLDDGTTWTLVAAAAGWAPRAFMAASVDRSNNLVISGGNSFVSGFFSDSWTSSDGGATWVADSSPAGAGLPRADSRMLLFQGCMWQLGGWSRPNTGKPPRPVYMRNDVYVG